MSETKSPIEDSGPAGLSLAVVIPAYRASATIRRAVDSALQSGASEVLVVDDGSQDSTAAIARQSGATVIEQANAGAAAARVNGARSVGADLIVFLDADDELIPSGVRGSVAVLEGSADVAVAAGTVIGVGAEGMERQFPIRFSPVTTETLLTRGHGPWPPAAAVVRRSAYVRALSVEPQALEPRFAEDYELLIRLSLVGRIEVRDEPTCRYSLAGGKSVSSAENAIVAKEAIREHYASALGIDIDRMSSGHVKMAAHVRSARAHWSSGRKAHALKEMVLWFWADPRFAASKLRSKPWTRN